MLGFFLYVTGYFMMSSFDRKEKNGLIDKANPHLEAGRYCLSRVKGLYPAFLMGTAFVFAVRNFCIGTKLADIPKYLVRAGWEFLGLYQIGMVNYNDAVTNDALVEILTTDEPSGVFAGVSGSATPLWNGPGWYISAIIIVSVLLYFILTCNRKFFLGFFCPLMIVGTYGYMGLAQGGEWDNTSVGFLGLPTYLTRVIAGICIGCLMFYAVKYIKEKKIPQTHKVAWNVFSIAITAIIVYTLWFGTEWNEVEHNIFLIPFTAIVLTGEDVISVFLNTKISGFCAYVGKLSLYWYISHWAFVFLMPVVFADLDYLPMAAVYVALSFVTANVLMLIDDKLVKPYITMRPKKADKTEAVKA